MTARIKNIVLYIYLFVMLIIFPLFFKKQYSGMGTAKFHIFLYASMGCFGILLVVSLIEHCYQTLHNFSKVFAKNDRGFSATDIAVIVYFLASMASFFFSSFKEESFMGADGWNMGLVSQCIFFLSYFYLSRDLHFRKEILYGIMVSTGIVFILGILHRFYIDPLGIYPGLSAQQMKQFLSTIGQSSWYSSFVCTVCPIGIYIFFISQNKKIRIASGIYTALTFMTLVTQNTDSAYLAIGVILLILFFLSFDAEWKMKRFFQIVLIMLASFRLMGLLLFIAGKHAVNLDSLSVEISQGPVSGIALIIILGGYLYWYDCKKKETSEKPIKRTFFWILFILSALTVLGMLLFIYLNSTGFLSAHFSYCNTNNYLLFTDEWGNHRGFSWRFCLFSFERLNVVEKIFGVGPDCFKAYNYNITEYAELLNTYWNNLTLTNAHNEYLTVLFNLGITGLAAFVMVIMSGIIRPLYQRKQNVYVAAFSICSAAYAVHNIFCYQQVCCTPFLFIFMGICENIVRTSIHEQQIEKNNSDEMN